LNFRFFTDKFDSEKIGRDLPGLIFEERQSTMSCISEPKCPICGGNHLKFKGRPQISPELAPFIRYDYKISKCLTCDFYFVYPNIDLTQQEWGNLYNKRYFAENTTWWKNKKAEHRRKRLGWLEKFATGKINRIIDIGCGEGYVLADALRKGWEVYGLDIADNRLEIARTEQVNFIKGNIFQASFRDNHFDAVYLDQVLEHVTDPLSHIREINRILRPGGTFYLGIPNENSLFNDFRRVVFSLAGRWDVSVRIKPFKSPFHIVGFTRYSIKKILENNNFSIKRFRVFGGEYDWRKFKLFTRGFLVNFLTLPVHLAAIPLNKRISLDAIACKNPESHAPAATSAR
jgi:SAM-dependent methyltransferase